VRSDGPIRFLSLSDARSDGLRHKFDTATGKFVGSFAASPVLTTTQLAARFLGYYGDDSCVPALRHLLQDPVEALQWESACALLRVRQDIGLEEMRRLSSSKDPAIARAAVETLQQYER
jgi:HEAT repeat protein